MGVWEVGNQQILELGPCSKAPLPLLPQLPWSLACKSAENWSPQILLAVQSGNPENPHTCTLKRNRFQLSCKPGSFCQSIKSPNFHAFVGSFAV